MRRQSREQEAHTSSQSSPGRDLFLKVGAMDVGQGSAKPNDFQAALLNRQWNNMSGEGKIYWEKKAIDEASPNQANEETSPSSESTDFSSDFDSQSE